MCGKTFECSVQIYKIWLSQCINSVFLSTSLMFCTCVCSELFWWTLELCSTLNCEYIRTHLTTVVYCIDVCCVCMCVCRKKRETQSQGFGDESRASSTGNILILSNIAFLFPLINVFFIINLACVVSLGPALEKCTCLFTFCRTINKFEKSGYCSKIILHMHKTHN